MNNWFVLSLISAIGFGIIPLFVKSLQDSISLQVLAAWYYTVAAILLWIIAFATTKVKVPDIKSFGLIFIVAAIAVIADLAIFYAYKLSSNAGFPRSVQTLSIVIATIMSALLYQQFPSAVGIIGTVVIFLGVAMFAFTK